MYEKRLHLIVGKLIDSNNEDTIMRIIDLLEEKKVSSATSLYEWSHKLGQEHISSLQLSDLINAWRESSVSCQSLVFGLRTAIETKRKITERIPQIELAWTGPYPPSHGQIRDIFAVMLEMFVSARKSILITGYSLSFSTIFPVAILDQLVAAKRRGCEIKMILHEDGKNYHRLTNNWPKTLPYPTLLRWVGSEEESLASLHAKLLIVDQKDMLITSANLTHHGLNSNIEVGIRVNGSGAKRFYDHFSALERAGIIQKVKR
jgi:phosphatidylserine/phosphatidylglycerophosphate/cardiolipin synthase-like enzyme